MEQVVRSLLTPQAKRFGLRRDKGSCVYPDLARWENGALVLATSDTRLKTAEVMLQSWQTHMRNRYALFGTCQCSKSRLNLPLTVYCPVLQEFISTIISALETLNSFMTFCTKGINHLILVSKSSMIRCKTSKILAQQTSRVHWFPFA